MCCHEALQSDKPDVARQALQLLLDALQQGMQQDDNAPGPNTSVYSCAVVLQNLLKFVTAADHGVLHVAKQQLKESCFMNPAPPTHHPQNHRPHNLGRHSALHAAYSRACTAAWC